ncbi:6-phosphogluconate dehydrogenase [Prauserella marina]|uniref:3-hydroxyisobutyrate dehydrogenase n=1 Tax=Prauserella marina TaxID=530584 RepID=A0A222VQQ5_9PSEU|nr:NAD(P)-binding domain-containing protein [Prauserella marina]ASR36224.1 6-phosphogluconate dehydrogenase [Prauserella marina]PWV76983.1 3-hydroxyisobutyrate dehydrogenase-like beta-hydroxyacid dehydrogenase [Prauserella marina]SDD01682.1 3-hydroxyisobutyrate dehydrogenase [Prauserella marina]
MNSTPVTVIGLGPMGAAMARVLLAGGHHVTVWNRTRSKADDLVAEGAVLAATPAEAIAASPLVVLSLTDYRAMYDILTPAAGSLREKVVVNLSSDSPQASREATEWFTGHGAQHVVGGVMVPPLLVGTDASYVFYSGPKAVFDRYEPMLRPIGRPEYRGEDPALAQLFYQAQLGIFLTTMAAHAHSSAILAAAGVAPTDYAPFAVEVVDLVRAIVPDTARHFEAGEHPGGLSSAAMMRESAAHVVAAGREAGLDNAVPEAVLAYYDKAIAAGYNTSDGSVLYEVIKKA